jgi:hypothetical protein
VRVIVATMLEPVRGAAAVTLTLRPYTADLRGALGLAQPAEPPDTASP